MTAVFIISAPSGSGKSTLVNNVRKLIPDLEFSVSYTTRAPRGNEQNGREYFFISRPEFEARIAKNEFLEYADVFGNYYGTARRFLQQAEEHGHDLLLDIDVQGAAQIKSKIPEAVSIFILPPNRQQLEQRLRDRGLDTEEVIQRRLLNASREIEVNDRLDESTENLKSILIAERLKRSGQRVADDSVRRRAESCRLDNVRERLKPILASFASTAVPGGN